MWFDFLMYIGKFLLMQALSELLRPRNKQRNPAGTLKDISFPTVDPTRPIQWLMGRRMIDNANLFGTFDFRGVERSKKVKTGLFTKDTVPLPPEYYISAGMVLCGGKGVRLREIWVGERLAWTGNVGNGAQVPISVSWTEDGQEDAPRGIIGTIEFYSGSTTPSAYLEAKRGAGNVPAWSHLTYVVMRGTSSGGAWIGTSRQVEQLKFVCERMPSEESTGIGALAASGEVGNDANPAYGAAEVITSKQYGAGIDPVLLNPASVNEAAQVFLAEAHGTSQLWDNQRVSGDVVLELCRQTGMVLQPDPTTGLLEMKVLRAADEPVLVLDDSNIDRIDEFTRSTMDEATNAMTVQYTDPADKWTQKSTDAQDLGAIEVAGQVVAGTSSYAGITNAALAGTLALRDLRAISSPLATARLRAIVPQRQRFMPGDAVMFSSLEHGVVSLRMRVTSARYANPGEALCDLELVEDVFRSGEAVYGVPAAVGNASNALTAPSTVGSGGGQDLISAPYALTGDDADRAMYYAFAPNVMTTSYDLAWSNKDPSYSDLSSCSLPPEYHQRGNIGFAAKGTLAAALPDIVAPGAIVLNVDAANAATLQRFGSQAAFVLVGTEVLQVTGIAVNTAGTQATLTGITRGLWDTVPVAAGVGSTVVVLCDYAIDVAPMTTTVTTDTHAVAMTINGQASLCAWAYGRNARGVSAAGGAIPFSYSNDWNSQSDPPGPARAALPYTPGNIKVNSVFGSSTQAAAPGVSGTLTVTWTPRNRLTDGPSAWAAETGSSEPSTYTTVATQKWNGSFWTTVATTTVNPGVTSAVVSAPVGPFRLLVSSYRTATGISGGVSDVRGQVWYFNRTS
jgi:hypothetical protein